MRKFGKYEKTPDGTKAKQPAVKSALLQTYFTSLICLVLCVTMFFGTTFAWFTREVTNSGNEIYIGTLDVDLLKQNKDNTWTSLNSEAGSTTKLFDKGIYWEPGYTALETVKVKDQGDLAFRYEMTFAKGSEVDDAAAAWFDVWCYHNPQNEIPEPENYAQITAANGWKKVGTLADVLSGKAVFKGEMDKEAVAANEEHIYTIALHMNGEKVTEDQQDDLIALMGKKISLNVKLVATQLSSEQDAFDNQYDANAKVPTIAPVKEAISFTAFDIFDDGNGDTTHNITMNTYKFVAADFQDAYPVEEYSDWTCDFFVSSDAGVKDGLILVGNYGTYGWLGFHVPESDEPYPPTGLLGIVSSGGESNWTYEAICNDVVIFSCGIHDSLNLNQGVEVTVDLRMTRPDKSETITVASVIVTLPDL